MSDERVPTKTADEKFCTECGSLIRARAEICPKCGVRQHAIPEAYRGSYVSGPNKLTAGLLAIFLGSFGVHKFYLGKPVQGIIYLLFCWTFVPAVIGFIEGLVYLSRSDESFAHLYARPNRPRLAY